jgi:hypothetical protein
MVIAPSGRPSVAGHSAGYGDHYLVNHGLVFGPAGPAGPASGLRQDAAVNDVVSPDDGGGAIADEKGDEAATSSGWTSRPSGMPPSASIPGGGLPGLRAGAAILGGL